MKTPTRRFGKTELQLPVLTCGGMRYQQSWQDDAEARASVTDDNQRNVEATLRHALELGINHIETARGYGTSEYQLGKILPSIPRDQIIVQTKVGPKDTPAEFLSVFEESMAALKLDYIDLLAIHGINNEETFQQAMNTLPALERLKREGRCRFIGFATHGLPDIAAKAIDTGAFDYVNLHWYFVYHPITWPSVAAAAKHDMGVLIISPNDKGGKLYEPSQKLVDLCAPLSPMAFNALYCLRRPEVHTLSIGAMRPEDFDLHAETVSGSLNEKFTGVNAIGKRLVNEIEKVFGDGWMQHWHENLPHWNDTPDEINIPEILRLYTFAKGLDMVEFAKMRYNLMGSGGHWFGGAQAFNVDSEKLKPLLAGSRYADRIPDMLCDAHALLHDAPQKRLSES